MEYFGPTLIGLKDHILPHMRRRGVGVDQKTMRHIPIYQWSCVYDLEIDRYEYARYSETDANTDTYKNKSDTHYKGDR